MQDRDYQNYVKQDDKDQQIKKTNLHFISLCVCKLRHLALTVIFRTYIIS